jgi:hypothetical protein
MLNNKMQSKVLKKRLGRYRTKDRFAGLVIMILLIDWWGEDKHQASSGAGKNRPDIGT